jgi:hypothetical protein
MNKKLKIKYIGEIHLSILGLIIYFSWLLLLLIYFILFFNHLFFELLSSKYLNISLFISYVNESPTLGTNTILKVDIYDKLSIGSGTIAACMIIKKNPALARLVWKKMQVGENFGEAVLDLGIKVVSSGVIGSQVPNIITGVISIYNNYDGVEFFKKLIEYPAYNHGGDISKEAVSEKLLVKVYKISKEIYIESNNEVPDTSKIKKLSHELETSLRTLDAIKNEKKE